jgi:hypothetical protein
MGLHIVVKIQKGLVMLEGFIVRQNSTLALSK